MEKRLGFLLGAGCLVFVFFSAFFHVSCVDPGFHVRTGEQVWTTGRIPTTNTFSSSMPEQPWLLHQWLPALWYYGVYILAGVQGLVLFKALVAAAIFGVVLAAARREAGGASLWPFWAVTAGVLLARTRFLERPFLFSDLLLAVVVYGCRRYPSDRRWWLVGLPLLAGFWANMHFGVLYGLALLMLFAAGRVVQDGLERYRTGAGTAAPERGALLRWFKRIWLWPAGILMFILVSGAAVAWVNPNGVKVLVTPVVFYLDPFWSVAIEELHPPRGPEAVLLACYLGLLVGLQAAAWRKTDFALLFGVIGFGVLAWRTQRAASEFAVVSVPYLAFLLESVWPFSIRGGAEGVAGGGGGWRGLAAPFRTGGVKAAAVIAVWAVLVWRVFIPDPTFRFGPGYFDRYYPMDVFRFMKENVPRQTVYNDMMYGGPMLWFVYPEFRPFVDGRGEAYSLEFWKRTYFPLSNGDPSWKQTFERYGIHGALVSHTVGSEPSGLARAILESPEWALVSFDNFTMFCVERTDANAGVIRDSEYRLLKTLRWDMAVTNADADAVAVEAGRALAGSPGNLFARTALARVTMLKGDFGRCLETLAPVMAGGRAGIRYARDYGYCLYRVGRRQEAEDTFRRLVARNQDDGFAATMLGFMAQEKGDHRAAAAWYGIAAELKKGRGP